MDLKDLYWVAGIIEGEGCFIMRGGKYPRVTVKMTDEDILKRCQEATGGIGQLRGPYIHSGGNKPMFSWDVSTMANAVGLMMTLYPLMGERRQAKIRACLAVWRTTHYPGSGYVAPGRRRGRFSKPKVA